MCLSAEGTPRGWRVSEAGLGRLGPGKARRAREEEREILKDSPP